MHPQETLQADEARWSFPTNLRFLYMNLLSSLVCWIGTLNIPSHHHLQPLAPVYQNQHHPDSSELIWLPAGVVSDVKIPSNLDLHSVTPWNWQLAPWKQAGSQKKLSSSNNRFSGASCYSSVRAGINIYNFWHWKIILPAGKELAVTSRSWMTVWQMHIDLQTSEYGFRGLELERVYAYRELFKEFRPITIQ